MLQKLQSSRFHIVLALVLFTSPAAKALKIDVSSEGHVVICAEGDRESTRLLDYFEGERFQPQFPRHEKYVYDKVRWALSRIEDNHPRLAQELSVRLKAMPEQVKFITGSDLNNGGGARPSGLPLSCRAVKALFRSAAADKKFVIQKDIWGQLPADDQAGMIFHGLLADYYQGQGASVDFSQIRSLVRLWSQGGPADVGLSRYVYGLRGLEALIGNIRLNGLDYRLDPANPLRVHENGQVAQGTMAGEDKAYTYKSDQGFALEISSKRGPVQLTFHPTGVPRRALLQDEIVEIPVQGRKLKFKYEISFHPNGQVKRGFFLSEYGLFLKMADGRYRRFRNME
ncbi:MAG: hypothetical protein KDD43_12635, partial [Bdellovibrionales bacterium]|nr:hypothetical protein [Bdellovibrionales bacterium]